MGESQAHHADWKKPDSEGSMGYESIYGTVWKGQTDGNRKHEWCPGFGVEEGLTTEGVLGDRTALWLSSWLHTCVHLSNTDLYTRRGDLYVSFRKWTKWEINSRNIRKLKPHSHPSSTPPCRGHGSAVMKLVSASLACSPVLTVYVCIITLCSKRLYKWYNSTCIVFAAWFISLNIVFLSLIHA